MVRTNTLSVTGGRACGSSASHRCDRDALVGKDHRSVAEGLAQRLSLPLIAKDEIKESLYDSLGAEDVSSSTVLGEAAYTLIFALARTIDPAGAVRQPLTSRRTP